MEKVHTETQSIKGVELSTFIGDVFMGKDMQKDSERIVLVIPVDSSARLTDSSFHQDLKRRAPGMHSAIINSRQDVINFFKARTFHMSTNPPGMVGDRFVEYPGAIDLIINRIEGEAKVFDENLPDGVMTLVVSQFGNEMDHPHIFNEEIIAQSICAGLANLNRLNHQNNVGFTGVAIPIITTNNPGTNEYEDIFSKGVSRGIREYLVGINEQLNTLRQIKQVVHSESPGKIDRPPTIKDTVLRWISFFLSKYKFLTK